LAISKRLAEMMGGSMWAESLGAGRGSTFSFSLPGESAKVAARKTGRDLTGIQPALRGKHLLIVDDNATNRRILVLQSRKWGMRPREFWSGREALQHLRAGEQFDAAILDLQMPEMDGVMLAREIRRLKGREELPIVLLTSLGRREVGAEGLDFAAFLTKPLKPSALFDALAGVFARRRVAPATASARAAIDPGMARRHPLRILLAEDNAVNQKLALRLLEQMGYRADVASNGVEAVESVERQPYDVILMDVQMPEMDGLAATRAIRRLKGKGRPHIIAMTANAMQGDREMCLAAGMDDYVSKPIPVRELVDALRKAKPKDGKAPGRKRVGSGAGPKPRGAASKRRAKARPRKP
jgi:CheY-like chemotaxis protein